MKVDIIKSITSSFFLFDGEKVETVEVLVDLRI